MLDKEYLHKNAGRNIYLHTNKLSANINILDKDVKFFSFKVVNLEKNFNNFKSQKFNIFV
jgi:hypothetical protein